MVKQGKLMVVKETFTIKAPPRTKMYRGQRYYFWRGELTMAGARKHSKSAIEAGYDVLLVRERFVPGANVYTNPSHR